MKASRWVLVGVIAVGAGVSSARAADAPRDLFDQVLSPELALGEAAALGLDARQREALQQLRADVQPRMQPLLRRMREERDALSAVLEAERPDEAAVLARFDKLNGVETELKRLRLQTTVAVKRILSAEQQTKALALRGKWLAQHPAPTGAEALPAKLKRVKEGLERWKREGRDVTRLRELWDRFREAEDKGFYRQARQALDEAIALLDAPPAPPHKPNDKREDEHD